jgi:hypothetical protein
MSVSPFATSERRGRLIVAGTPATAFVHFTPEGERLWVPDWTPEYLHPRDGALVPGLRFRTRHGGEETLWLVADLDVVRGRVTYVRITPGSRYGTVSVRVTPSTPHESVVEVGYSLTPLSLEGEAKVAALLSNEGFAEMLREWQERIGALTAA